MNHDSDFHDARLDPLLDRQEEFGTRLAELFDRAAEVIGGEATFEAALGGLAAWALTRTSGPSVAITLHRLAAELASRRGADTGPMQ